MDPSVSHSQEVVCRYCGRIHHLVPLKHGERALCIDCGTTLARRPISPNAALAFTVTALLLAVPAIQLPLVTVAKFGNDRASHLWSGVQALWEEGMPMLSVWVATCGIVVPLALLTTLTVVVLLRRFGEGAPRTGAWSRFAHALQHWSMPEVQVLAVLVAFVKIGALVNVRPGAGLWFYAGMTFAMMLAWRSTEVRETS